ncbi:hypothetical protein HW511_07710 [Asaia siamensis]|uniref:hypothetical protein n=1 Tax=Asaia siamensis TaxID=110479 RepID=UPI0016648A75|nr:hypothetical protein [Asaia siamensis]
MIDARLDENIRNHAFLTIAFLSIIFLYLLGKGQLDHTFVQLDDWEFMTLVPSDLPTHGGPWEKTLWEGRWLNFFWAKIATHFSVRENYIIFVSGYSLFCLSFSSMLVKSPLYRLIISLVVFISPEYGDLSLWPATLAPSVWIIAISIFLFKKTENLYIIFISQILLILSYPPVSLLLFVSVSLKCDTTLQIARNALSFCVAYFISVISIYTLNYFFHGVFGVQIAGWRHPHSIHDFTDLIANFANSSKGLYRQYATEGHYIQILFISFLVSALIRPLGKIKIFIPISLFCVFVDFSIPFLTGTDVVGRTILWPWLVIVAIALGNLENMNTKAHAMVILSFCIGILVYGNVMWNKYYIPAVHKESVIENIGNTILQHGEERVFICGNVADMNPFKGEDYYNTYIPFVLNIWKNYHVKIFPYYNCNAVSSYGFSQMGNDLVLKIN